MSNIKTHIQALFGVDDQKYAEIVEYIAQRMNYSDTVVSRDEGEKTVKPNPVSKEQYLVNFLKEAITQGVKRGMMRAAEARAQKEGTEQAETFSL